MRSGGESEMIHAFYFETGQAEIEKISLNADDARNLLVNLIDTLRYLKHRGIDIDENDMRIPVSAASHSFNIDCSSRVIKEAISSSLPPDEWVEREIIQNGKTIPIADTNWQDPRSGQNICFCIARADMSSCMLVLADEQNRDLGGVSSVGVHENTLNQEQWLDKEWTLFTDPRLFS